VEQTSNALFWRLKEQAGHGVVLAIIAKQLNRIAGHKIAANRLTIRIQIKTQQESNHCRHGCNQNGFAHFG
jgi:hypothetical protein